MRVRWASTDPNLEKYLPTGNREEDATLPGMGGVFNTPNLGLYAYVHHNPLRFVDPDGLEPYSEDFWAAYLNYDKYLGSDVWNKVGGQLGQKYAGEDSCATRVSYGLNYGGEPIPRGAPGANRNYNGDEKRYIISARQLRSYLRAEWGHPITLKTVDDLKNLKAGLKDGQVAIVVSTGHAAVVKKGYDDPYVESRLGEAWVLPVKPPPAPANPKPPEATTPPASN